MPACARTGKVDDQPTIGNLFFPVPDTDVRDFLDEVAQLLRFAPEIITAIEGDLDAHALAKKKLRLEDRKSETYRDARRYRSAVESLLFTLKDGFAFGELGRRGIDAVRAELLEKVLAYNCCRRILLRQRQREALERAA